ncbi:toll-interacting protein-like [Condylostylus longicornis]|uniref:toll-interacting protein-like n=1 Tax=Condylostylus longicornis TaxID=2530218 RepID=UPI00244E52F9|nr:toll-interacting protein-like [Condylostylus longicornis]
MASATENTKEERWKRAVIGPLPTDFLRIHTAREIQEAADCQAAMALYQQQQVAPYMAPNIVGRLSITVAQAKLVRNYGLTRMDPYVRVRVGHFVYETQTDPNGGKTPRWNRVIQTQLPAGVHSISIEIYDECSFKMDELIAWTEIKIPENVLRGETHEEWYPLSGKQGDGIEGQVDLVLSFSAQSIHPYMYQAPAVLPVAMVPNVAGRPMPVFVAPQQPQVAPPVTIAPVKINEEDMKQVQEMFPNIDKEVVKSVFEANRGNKDTTINSLLQMTD